MYHAFFALKPNVFLLFSFSCINISEHGGAMGVALKWKSPSMAAHAERRKFCLHFLTMLMHKINNGIPPTNIPNRILVQTSTSNRFQHQHCEKMQTILSPLSMGGHGRRVPFQRHPRRSTRLRNFNARKSKQKKDIWFQRKKGMVHSTMFQTLPKIQGHNVVNWCRKTIRHGKI